MVEFVCAERSSRYAQTVVSVCVDNLVMGARVLETSVDIHSAACADPRAKTPATHGVQRAVRQGYRGGSCSAER